MMGRLQVDSYNAINVEELTKQASLGFGTRNDDSNTMPSLDDFALMEDDEEKA